jgi:riboflavin synthase
MFTGLVESVGIIEAVEPMPSGFGLRIAAGDLVADLAPGASVAVDGVCLTAVEISAGEFTTEVSPETALRTNMGEYRTGTRVNLERPLRVGAELGGHFVQGHVDAVCRLIEVVEGDDFVRISLSIPDDQRCFLVEKGSVAVNGVSLTVASLTADGFEVQLIPHTLERTNLVSEDRAEQLNLEVDILGKYVAQFVAPHLATLTHQGS